MAKPLSSVTLSALALPTQDLTPVQIYSLSVQGLIEPEGDLLIHSKKAGRATARMAKQAELETVKVQVFGALKELGKDSEMMFRLDDVLKPPVSIRPNIEDLFSNHSVHSVRKVLPNR